MPRTPTHLHVASALLPTGWTADVRIALDGGRIAAVETGAAPQPGDDRQAVVVPAMPNLHSHAFQRAMAGRAERRGPGDDSFWSWRTEMYRLALSMDPDQIEAVAAQVYMEMLEAGFARVGEFHYLHHDRDGRPYADLAEHAARIAAASAATGISLTLLPVLYGHSGFGGALPSDGQRRFVNDLDRFAALMDGCRRLTDGLEGAVLGVAPHSLRAVTPDGLQAAAALAAGGPIHIHVAEQVREVEECLAWSGARPVEWLLANAPVNERWCLVHATHMNPAEINAMAASGAVAGLCPITEANLGDGIFPAGPFAAAGGRFGIGSDSNVDITLPGELRQLEYSQRLGTRARNVLAEPGQSTGRFLYDGGLAGGGRALGSPSGIAIGQFADLVSLDLTNVPWLREDDILDAWIFARGVDVDGVWARGSKVVAGGRHHAREAIGVRFTGAMQALHCA